MATGKMFLLSLCSLLLLSQLVVPVQSWSCCLSYTKRNVPCKRLLSFRYQKITQSCDINAVVFRQNKDRFLCADPLSQHYQRCIKQINDRRQKEAQFMKA